jgi:hypothetical protein
MMTENMFRSRIEDLMPAVELDFPPTPAFGDYRPYLEHASNQLSGDHYVA